MTRGPFDFAVRRPGATLALVALAVLALLVHWAGAERVLAVDPSIRALLPRGGEELARFEDVRERFSSDDLLLVTWLGDGLCTPAGLAAFKRLARRIERLPGVEQVDSLARAVRTEVHADFTVVEPYLATLPTSAAAARALCAAARQDPLHAGYLVSRDGRGATIAVRFQPGLDARTLIARVRTIAAASRAAAGDIEEFVSGPLYARLEISRLLLADLYRVMPLAVAATLVVVLFGLRSVRGVVLPLAANGTALLAVLGVFVARGHTLNYVTVILPPTVYVVGFAYAIHVVGDFDRHYARGLERLAAARAALAEVVVPLSLTALTTALGFAALALSPIEAIGVFGGYAALGTACAWATALTVVPAGLVLLPARRPA
ncbi:MAG: MMPL family transporter, partial [Gammaproteobacteria bacterium]|nr:MMPL family transporter [Gammaproteobacteria bacterium]